MKVWDRRWQVVCLVLIIVGGFASSGARANSCNELEDINLVDTIDQVVNKYIAGLNSARGEPKLLIKMAEYESFFKFVEAQCVETTLRDKPPRGKRLATTTYYPHAIKSNAFVVQEFLRSVPAEMRPMYEQVLKEYLGDNRIRMREYLIGSSWKNPYRSKDVNRGFKRHPSMTIKFNGKNEPFFFLEWKIKQYDFNGVDLTSHNPNVKPSLPVSTRIFRDFFQGRITAREFAAQSREFYEAVAQSKKEAGTPLKDEVPSWAAETYYRKHAIYFEAIRAIFGPRIIERRVTYMRKPTKHKFQTNPILSAEVTAKVKTALQNLGYEVPAGRQNLTPAVTEALQKLVGAKLGKQRSNGTLEHTFQITSDKDVFFESVGDSLAKKDWRGVIDAEAQAGSVNPKGTKEAEKYSFVEFKFDRPWIALMTMAKTNPDVRVLVEATAPHVREMFTKWDALQQHQYQDFGVNRGKRAYGEVFVDQ